EYLKAALTVEIPLAERTDAAVQGTAGSATLSHSHFFKGDDRVVANRNKRGFGRGTDRKSEWFGGCAERVSAVGHPECPFRFGRQSGECRAGSVEVQLSAVGRRDHGPDEAACAATLSGESARRTQAGSWV